MNQVQHCVEAKRLHPCLDFRCGLPCAYFWSSMRVILNFHATLSTPSTLIHGCSATPTSSTAPSSAFCAAAALLMASLNTPAAPSDKADAAAPAEGLEEENVVTCALASSAIAFPAEDAADFRPALLAATSVYKAHVINVDFHCRYR